MGKKILIINSSNPVCGVWQYGHNLCSILQKSKKHQYTEHCFENEDSLKNIIPEYDLAIWNYHNKLFPWITDEFIKQFKTPITFIGGHDCYAMFPSQKHTLDAVSCNPATTNSTPIPRPISYFEQLPNPKRITVGTCGFNFHTKNYHHIIALVCQSFDDAVIRFHITNHHDGNSTEYITKQMQNELNKYNKPNINVEISTNFLTEEGLVNFLSSNTINVFMYSENKNRGLSSAIDKALASQKPFAITDSYMFRHISHESKFLLSKHSLNEIIEFGTDHIKPFWEKYSEENLINCMDSLVDRLLCY